MIIFSEGDICRELLVIKEGTVKLGDAANAIDLSDLFDNGAIPK